MSGRGCGGFVFGGTVAVLWKGMCLDEGGGICVIGIDCVKMAVVVDILIGCF